MVVFAIPVEYSFDVAIQGSHDADPREHCRPGSVDFLRKPDDVVASV
jgi:hypothetical protein